MVMIKRCELCKSFMDCNIHDKVCGNLKFLQNFLDIKESEDVAKYCSSYKRYSKKRIKLIKQNLKKCIITDIETGKDISELVNINFLGLETPKVDDVINPFTIIGKCPIYEICRYYNKLDQDVCNDGGDIPGIYTAYMSCEHFSFFKKQKLEKE